MVSFNNFMVEYLSVEFQTRRILTVKSVFWQPKAVKNPILIILIHARHIRRVCNSTLYYSPIFNFYQCLQVQDDDTENILWKFHLVLKWQSLSSWNYRWPKNNLPICAEVLSEPLTTFKPNAVRSIDIKAQAMRAAMSTDRRYFSTTFEIISVVVAVKQFFTEVVYYHTDN